MSEGFLKMAKSDDAKKKAMEAWDEAKKLRSMLEQTLNREQRRELNLLLEAWRRGHLRDTIAVGGEEYERIARRFLGEL